MILIIAFVCLCIRVHCSSLDDIVLGRYLTISGQAPKVGMSILEAIVDVADNMSLSAISNYVDCMISENYSTEKYDDMMYHLLFMNDSNNLSLQERSNLMLGLHRTAHRSQNYEVAWQALSETNEYEKRKAHISTNKFWLTVPQLFPNVDVLPPMNKRSFKDLIFIVGFPFSGVDLLGKYLNCHSKVFALSAKDAYMNLLPSDKVDKRLKHGFFNANFEEIYGTLMRSVLETSHSNGDTFISQKTWTTPAVQKILEHYSRIIRDNMMSVAKTVLFQGKNGESTINTDHHRLDPYKKESLFVLDTEWSNYKYLGILHLLFPGARVIHAVRDPMQVMLLNYQQRHAPTQSGGTGWSFDLTALASEYGSYLAMMSHWQSTLPQGAIVHVSTQALLSDPTATLKQLLKELDVGLKYEKAMPVVFRASHNTSHSCQLNIETSSSADDWCAYRHQLQTLQQLVQPVIHSLAKTDSLPLSDKVDYTFQACHQDLTTF